MVSARPEELMCGVVLAGTFPWANSAFDQLAPRPLVPLVHRPLIGFALSWLQTAGVCRVVVCGNRNTRALQQQLAPMAGSLSLSYLEDAMPRGAAGCAYDAAQSCPSQTFVVTDATAMPNVDLADVLSRHYLSGAAMTMVVYPEPRGAGESALHVPAGLYVLTRRVVDAVAPLGFVDIKEHLIPKLVRAGERIATYAAAGAVPRVLNARTYLAASDVATQLMVARRALPPDYELRGTALVHRDARVDGDATLAGPVIVAAGASIAGNAVVIGPASIGCDAVIEAGAVVSRSTIWRRSRIAGMTVVDRSIVGDDAIIGQQRQVNRSIVLGHARPTQLWTSAAVSAPAPTSEHNRRQTKTRAAPSPARRRWAI